MSASTISNNINCSIILDRTNQDLGPCLKCRIIINGKTIDTLEIKEQKVLSYKIDIKNTDNYLEIEHYDRHNTNTETDNKDNIVRTSLLLINDIKIDNVKFYATSIHSQNKFIPKYDESYLEWARKNEPSKNFPDEMDASPQIGINGKFILHFKWPLYLHGLYHSKSF